MPDVSRLAFIGPGCVLGPRTKVSPFAHLEADVTVGRDCFIGPHANLRPRTVIGDRTVFGTMSQSEGDNHIGSDVTIHTGCHITKAATIEDKVFIAPGFIGANTPRISHGRKFEAEVKGYSIGYGARIGIGVLVMPGVRIGREALVGAGSLVTRSVPDFAVAYGRPARVVGVVPEDERL